jgi:HEAT repeat protein
MENLFKRERYEEYVEDDYDRLLKGISEKAARMAEAKTGKFPVRDYLQTFEDQHLDFQIGRALVAFMEEKIDEEDYREFAKKLGSLIPDLLRGGNFSLLLDILTTLRWHLTDKQQGGIRSNAADLLKIFWQPSFIAGAVKAFDAWAQTKARAAGEFLLALGPATIPGLLDLYAADAEPGGRRVVFDLLAAFGDPAVNGALKRLSDPRPEFVRNLLMLVRRAGTARVVPAVKQLLKHPDAKVRLEAIAVLLRFKDPAAVGLLQREILSKDPDVSSQAVHLVGQYRVTEVVASLRALLKHVVFFESDYAVNEELIRALGEIGDPRAVPDLEKLARSSLSLHPGSHARMKRTIFESLQGYPRESIRGLLKIGERSDDESIRKTCRQLAPRTGGTGGPMPQDR